MQSGAIVSFNDRMHDELLNAHLVYSLRRACNLVAAWTGDFNNHRKH
jgi:hypothetical protein